MLLLQVNQYDRYRLISKITVNLATKWLALVFIEGGIKPQDFTEENCLSEQN